MPPSSVLLVGGGELGTVILEALSTPPGRQSGPLAVLLCPETIKSSDPSKKASNTHLQSLGAELIPGNFVDNTVSELVAIFKHYDIVIQAGGYGLRAGTQLKSTQAALEAGVKRYFPWQFGVDYEAIGEGSAQDLFDEMLEVRKVLGSQDKVEWTVISTGLFMSYLFLPDFEVVDFERRTLHALGSWENRVTVTTPRDIGVMTAEMVYVPENTANRVVYIGGDTISYGQLADLLDGTKFEREKWSLQHLKQRLQGSPDNLWYKYQCIFGDGKGIAWDQAKTLNQQRSVPLTTAAEYVEQSKGSWTLGS